MIESAVTGLVAGFILGCLSAYLAFAKERDAMQKLFDAMQTQLKDHHEMVKLRLGYRAPKETTATVTDTVTDQAEQPPPNVDRTTPTPKPFLQPPNLMEMRQKAIEREAYDAQKRRKDVQMVKDMAP